MAMRKIGEATTDSQGVASYSYTGVGAGLLNLRAKLKDSTLQSKTYSILDCIKKDNGTQSNHNDMWSTNSTSSLIIITRATEYTEFAEATTGSNFSNATDGLQEGCAIEFDYYQVDGGNNSFLQILDSNSTLIYTGGINIGTFGGTPANWYHLKFEMKNGTMTCTNTTNGTTFTRSYTNAPSRFNWWSSGEISAIRFKNFQIYPLFDHSVSTINITGADIIQTGQTSILTITPRGTNGYPVPNTLIDLYKDGTKITTLDTGATGKATYTYTANGSGEHSFRVKYGTIQSEIFTLEDCLYYDSATSDTSSRYHVDTTKDNSIAFSDSSLVVTCGSQYRYLQLGYGVGMSNLYLTSASDWVGKNIIFKADVQTSSKVRIHIIEYVEGYTNITTDNSEIQEDGTISGKASISNNATKILFRVDAQNSRQGDVIKINNLRIYPI